MLLLGGVLLAGGGAYYGYGVYAHSGLEELNYTVVGPVSLPAAALGEGFVSTGVGRAADVTRVEQMTLDAVQASPRSEAADTSPSNGPAIKRTSISVASYGLIYPGSWIHPKYWEQPLWAGTDPYPDDRAAFPDGFQVVSTSNPVPVQESAPAASRLVISTLGIDSVVQELQILDLGDSRAYETPDNVVGHIPETANPGGTGNAWFFGHLESRLSGEGNVFQRLPEISDLLRDGESVYVKLMSDDAEYLYQVTDFVVIPQEDLVLHGSEDSTVTLVTCYPTLYYDQRVVVTAKLVGVKG